MGYTYLQIKQIEECIKEARGFRRSDELKSEELFRLSKTLYAKIQSLGFTTGIILPFHWDKLDVDIVQQYDDNKVKENLYVIETSLQGILNAIPYYSDLCSVREDIQRGKRINENRMDEFIIEMSVKYGEKIDFGKTVQEHIKKSTDFIFCGTDNTKAIFNGVISKLELYLSDLCKEKPKKSHQKNEPKTVVNINQTAQQTINQTIDLSFEECFKSIDDCETINKEEIQELKSKIGEIQELLKDKKGKKSTIKEKISKILHFIAEKGTDVMIALLPTVVSVVQSL